MSQGQLPSAVDPELRVRQLEQQLRVLEIALSNTPDFTYTFDLQGRFSYVNRALLELWRRPFSEAVGKNFFELNYPPELAARLQRQIQQVIDTCQPLRDETPFTGAEGTIGYYEYIFVPICAGDGTVEAVAGSTRNITDRKRAEQALAEQTRELARSNADLQQFAFVTSHDLQEPLRTIVSFSQLLTRNYKDKLDGAALEFLDHIVAGGLRMKLLIDSLLAYSRIVNAEALPLAPVSLEVSLDWALMNLETVVQESHATITHGDLPTVESDQVYLVQVFQNLMLNAIKYARPGVPPRIHVTVESQASEWVIAVQDNGEGIAPEYMDQIFGVFKRLHGAEIPGTGIGLAICKRIVEKSGGRIWVESRVGEGSTFYFSLPA